MPSFLGELRDLTLPKLAAFLTGAAAALYIIIHCARSGDPILPWLALSGAIVGWIIGVLATPFPGGEKEDFGAMAKVISGFVSGYLLSKADPLVDALFAVPEGARAAIMEPHAAEQFLVTISSFGIALLFVFNARLYWSTQKELCEWIDKQDPKPSRSEAIRQLVERASKPGR